MSSLSTISLARCTSFFAQKVPDDFRSEAESLDEGGGASLGQGLSEGGTEPDKAVDEEMGASAGSASGLHGGGLRGGQSRNWSMG